MIDILLDAIIDALKLIPFLFLSFMIMELIEHKLNNQKKLVETKKYGPLIGSSLGALVDGQLTKVVEVEGKQLVKVVAWYDNEMGYSYQMVRTLLKM